MQRRASEDLLYSSQEHRDFCKKWKVSGELEDYAFWQKQMLFHEPDTSVVCEYSLRDKLDHGYYGRVTADLSKLLGYDVDSLLIDKNNGNDDQFTNSYRQKIAITQEISKNRKKLRKGIDIWTPRNIAILLSDYFEHYVDLAAQNLTPLCIDEHRDKLKKVLTDLVKLINRIRRSFKKYEFESTEVNGALEKFDENVRKILKDRMSDSVDDHGGPDQQQENPKERETKRTSLDVFESHEDLTDDSSVKPQIKSGSIWRSLGYVVSGAVTGLCVAAIAVLTIGSTLPPLIAAVGVGICSALIGGVGGWCVKKVVDGIKSFWSKPERDDEHDMQMQPLLGKVASNEVPRPLHSSTYVVNQVQQAEQKSAPTQIQVFPQEAADLSLSQGRSFMYPQQGLYAPLAECRTDTDTADPINIKLWYDKKKNTACIMLEANGDTMFIYSDFAGSMGEIKKYDNHFEAVLVDDELALASLGDPQFFVEISNELYKKNIKWQADKAVTWKDSRSYILALLDEVDDDAISSKVRQSKSWEAFEKQLKELKGAKCHERSRVQAMM